MAINTKKRIRLGIPLDLLFDRECDLLHHESQGGVPGGIILPTNEHVGTGNIVIRGRPGTGKSILALQIALKCCQFNPGYFSCFIALEETPEHVKTKAASFGWSSYLHEMRSLNCLSEFASPREYGETLRRILTQSKNCPVSQKTSTTKAVCKGEKGHNKNICPSQVLLSSLSPRDLSLERSESIHVYSERYKQLENLLAGAKWWRKQVEDKENRNLCDSEEQVPGIPDLRVVCIDSLNVFGNHLLTREQIHRLFDLFKRHQVIGVFVLEEDEAQVMSPDNTLHSDTIEYLADVVISLQAEEDEGYFIRYFEIVKSRFQHQIYGKHPFKIANWKEKQHENDEEVKNNGRLVDSKSKQPAEESDDEIQRKKELLYLLDERTKYNTDREDYSNTITQFANKPVAEGIVIYPSLHYIVYGTSRQQDSVNVAVKD